MTRSLKTKLGKTMTKAPIETQIAVMAEQIRSIDETVREIKQKMERDYVTQDQFRPVRSVVYGLVTIILTAVVGGLVGLVVLK